ncbi:CPBP family intramembrane glutamic endopeptidase [Nakamurella leprariae]|uniref:CPBP family intramembrane metalloprotease n=1 Tax=Nakamurella leprariae TaxID=2803911 RepID=A0A939C3H5_9ACTN|nr:type II CAAX endopeptidase family protein [Nakamurella leprariae]MBM9469107.1 CPBP family intramembrane metalloprotease [Nakamurella leprariae]
MPPPARAGQPPGGPGQPPAGADQPTAPPITEPIHLPIPLSIQLSIPLSIPQPSPVPAAGDRPADRQRPGSDPAPQSLPPSAPQRTGWSLRDVLAAFGVILLVTTGVQTVLQLSDVRSVSSVSVTLVFGVLPIWIGLVGTCWWAVRAHGTGSFARDLGLRFRWIDLAVGLGLGVGLRVAAVVITLLVQGVTASRPSGNVPFSGQAGGNPMLIALLVLFVGLLGPLIEEVFFRGLGLRSALATLQRADARRGRRPRDRRMAAVWITSSLFAFLHFPEVTDVVSLVTLAPTLLLGGVAFGLVSMHYRRIGPAIVGHVVFNATALLPLAFA